ncbi:MAG: chromate transporter [Victivallaceae bacterium]|nr:chromate transporter [Victivallaceae bacterium]
MKILRRCLILFWAFAKIAAVVLGGGLAMLPVIEEEFSVRKKYLSRDDLLEMVALSQTVPGIIAANCAVYVGMKVAGFFGALAALLGAVLPSFTVILLIAVFFPRLDPHNALLVGVFPGVRAAVAALIVSTAFRMTKKVCRGAFEIALGAAVLILVLNRVNPGLLIVSSIPFGLLARKIRLQKEEVQ